MGSSPVNRSAAADWTPPRVVLQGTASRIEGVGFEALAMDTLAQHGIAYHGHLWPEDSADAGELPNPGDYHFRCCASAVLCCAVHEKIS